MVLTGKHIFFSLLAWFLVCPCPPAGAGPAAGLNNITILNTDDDLLLHLQLEGAFSEKIKNQILGGNPTSFAFSIRLDQVVDLWPDRRIADLHVEHTIRYDRVKKEFTVRRSWKGNEAETTTSFEEAQKWMNEIDSIVIVPLNRLQRGTQYELISKAEISRRTLPFSLHHALFFMSFWDEETDWYIINFTY
jgi:hypothetical protein